MNIQDKSHDHVNILGVNVSKLGVHEVVNLIGKAASLRTKTIFDYANVHALNTAYETPWLRDFYNRCEVVFCDGYGVKLATSILGDSIPQRFTPPDWISSMARQCLLSNQTLFFLGGR